MKIVKNFFFLILFFSLTSFNLHKFYISITQVNYVEKQHTIQITTRIFIDDLQKEINNISNTNIELASDREPKDISKIYNQYLNKHLQFIVNKKKTVYNYIGREYEKDLVIFYLEIENIDEINELEINNRVLYNSFNKQENIVKTNIYNKNKSFILTTRDQKALVKF
jgi:hypothetical protein